jgi:hypothetical protein
VTGLAVAIGPLLGGILTSGLSASRPDLAGFALFTAARRGLLPGAGSSS